MPERLEMAELKKPTTYQQQLALLRKRKIIIDDSSRCLEVLETVNYYRLTAYLLPFKCGKNRYISGTKFSTVYRIYEFDRKIRGVLLVALEEVETYLRSKFAYFHAHKYGEVGYMKPENYSIKYDDDKFQTNLNREITSNEGSAFVQHHQKEYGGRFPIWVAIELFSFGMLSRFYSDMKTADKKELARDIYNTVPKNIISWLRCCTDLRNICAHYGRLYYRIFTATPASVAAGPTQRHQLWGATLALQALYPNAEKWNTEILPQLSAVFSEYGDDIELRHIGFPQNWEERLRK